MLIDYGNYTVGPEWVLDEKTAPGYSRVYYLYEGDILYQGGAQECRLAPGHLYVFPTTIPYRARRMRNKPIVHTYLHVEHESSQITGLIDLPVSEHTALSHFVRTLRAAIDEKRIDLVEGLSSLVVQFVKDSEYCLDIHGMLADVRKYVYAHLADKITLKELSDLYHYHPNYFVYRFQKETGFTPYQCILSTRMRFAASLINRGVSVAEAAQQTGYSDASSFARSFKRHYSMSPSEYVRTRRQYAQHFEIDEVLKA